MSLLNIHWSPEKYAETAVIAREAGLEMLARLDWVTLAPQVVLDVGCGVGEMSGLLQKRYPDAQVISIDLSEDMLQSVKGICSDASILPFADQSIDLVFANFLLPWHHDIGALLKEWRRVLKPNGLLMVTALGIDTLREWREVWGENDIPRLADMHDIGDALVLSGFADPVMDVDYCTLTYTDPKKLVEELQTSGMLSLDANIPSEDQMPKINDKWQVTYELIYAHAWAPEKAPGYAMNADGVAKIPLASLRRKANQN